MRRGVLFAPVYYQEPLYTRANYTYTPSAVISTDLLTVHLFARPRYCHYYFGDYFDQRYERQGYVPWTRYRQPGAAFDGLFGYYRQHAGERGWEHAIQGLYAARYTGKAPRPPRTLVEQEKFVRQGTAQRTLPVEQIQQAAVLAPLAQYERSGYKLEKLRREEFMAYKKEQLRRTRDAT